MTVYDFNGLLHHAPSRTQTHTLTHEHRPQTLLTHTSGSCLGRLSGDWFFFFFFGDLAKRFFNIMPFTGACVTLSLFFGLFWLFQFALTNTTLR